MAITAKDVKQLRDKTGAGIMDCKRALTEAKGDVDAAVDLLRKKGRKVAAKRAHKETLQGLIVARVSADGRTGVIAEVNCETDFVARNDEFVSFADSVARTLLTHTPADVEALLACEISGGQTVGQALIALTGKIGENMGIRRCAVLSSPSGHVVAYVHPGAQLGVLVALSGNGQIEDTGRDVAMQVAALNPVAAFRTEVPEAVQAREIEIGREAARSAGRPAHVLDRIARGYLEKYFKDHVLVDQPFVKDASVSVRDILTRAGAELHRFVRYQLGN